MNEYMKINFIETRSREAVTATYYTGESVIFALLEHNFDTQEEANQLILDGPESPIVDKSNNILLHKSAIENLKAILNREGPQ